MCVHVCVFERERERDHCREENENFILPNFELDLFTR